MRGLYFDGWLAEQIPIIGQGSQPTNSGWTAKFAATFYWRFERKTKSYACNPNPFDKDVVARRWVFIGITYDPITDKYHCLLDGTRFDAVASVINKPNQPEFTFTARQTYLMDDLIYLPKYVTIEEHLVIYNQSKWRGRGWEWENDHVGITQFANFDFLFK